VTASQAERAAAFAALHAGPPFVMPNPWDAGSAQVLAGLGFQALATTSSGWAWTLGRADGETTLDELLAHVQRLGTATDLPLSVDLEDGRDDPGDAIARVAEAGAVGASIEDWDPRAERLYPHEEAVERLAAAVAAAARLAFPFTLTARAENHIRGHPDLEDTIARLRAFETVGAEVLYAPGLETPEEIRAVCDAVAKPVNVLARPGLTLAQIAAAGAQRVSLGGALTWVARDALAAAATRIRDEGTF